MGVNGSDITKEAADMVLLGMVFFFLLLCELT